MVDLPTPIIPTSTIGRSIRAREALDLAVGEAAGLDGHCRKRYRWANRPCKFAEGLRLVAMRLKKIWLGLLVLLVLFLVVAWYDGGREPQRLIEQPVELPEGPRT